MTRHREEVINVYLAECIRDRGMRASGEQIEFKGGKRAMPDVLLDYMGLRCMIEGKVGDHADASQEVFQNAAGRLESGIAHIAIGVVYPTALRTTEEDAVKEALARESMHFFIGTENNFAKPEWQDGTVDEIMSSLRRSHEDLMKNDVVERTVAKLRYGMEPLIIVLSRFPVASDHLIEVLEICEPPRETAGENDE